MTKDEKIQFAEFRADIKKDMDYIRGKVDTIQGTQTQQGQEIIALKGRVTALSQAVAGHGKQCPINEGRINEIVDSAMLKHDRDEPDKNRKKAKDILYIIIAVFSLFALVFTYMHKSADHTNTYNNSPITNQQPVGAGQH
jgi:hypothetical protein